VRKDLQEPRELLVQRESRAQLEMRVRLGYAATLERQVKQALWDMRAKLAQPGPPGSPDLPELQAVLEPLDLQAWPVPMVHREVLAPPVEQVSLAWQVPPVISVLQERSA